MLLHHVFDHARRRQLVFSKEHVHVAGVVAEAIKANAFNCVFSNLFVFEHIYLMKTLPSIIAAAGLDRRTQKNMTTVCIYPHATSTQDTGHMPDQLHIGEEL